MIDPAIVKSLEEEFRGEMTPNAPMSEKTSIRIGGPADLWLVPADLECLARAVTILREAKIPIVPFGNGSNALVRDGGIRGATISLKECCGEIEALDPQTDRIRVRVGAGVPLQAFIRKAGEMDAEGPEGLVGIPASMGGALAMNAGTSQGEIGDWVEELTVYNERGNFQKIPAKKIKWKYRGVDLPPKAIIVSAIFSMNRGDPQRMEEIRKSTLEYRRETQPIDQPSLGSVFKNPGDKEKAGALIDEAGLKGVRLRQAMISGKHANWIVNLGGATAADVTALIKMIQEKIKERTGVRLEPEIKVIGEE